MLHVSRDTTDTVCSTTRFNRTGRRDIFNISALTNPADKRTHRNRFIRPKTRGSRRSCCVYLDILQDQVLNCSYRTIFYSRNNPKQSNILGIGSNTILGFSGNTGYITIDFGCIDIKIRNGKALTIKNSFKPSCITSTRPNRNKQFPLHVKGTGQLKFFSVQSRIRHLARNPRQLFRSVDFVIVVSRILGSHFYLEIAPTRARGTVKSKRLPHGKQSKHHTQSSRNCKFSHTLPRFFPKIEKNKEITIILRKKTETEGSKVPSVTKKASFFA